MLMVLFLRKFLTVNKKRNLSENLQLRFLKQLQRFLENGYSLLDSLERIKWDEKMIPIATYVIDQLKAGHSIDQALEQLKFHYTITSYLYFVKEHGNLLESIKKCVEVFNKRIHYKEKFQQMIRYPLLLLLIFMVLLFFIKQMILPSFMNIFQTNENIPSTIKYSLMIINYFIPIVLLLITFLIISIYVFSKYKKKLTIDFQEKVYQLIPIYRNYLKKQTSFQFSTHLSALLQTGMPLKDILYYMTQQTKLPVISYYSSLMLNTLNRGLAITQVLPNLYFMERQITDIFMNNSDKSSLEKDLSAFAKMTLDELHRNTMNKLKFIQPIFFIILGVFIVIIYLILMWPMFQLINQL